MGVPMGSVMTEIARQTCLFIQARFAKTERGASLIEYAFLVGLIAIVCLSAVTFFGGQTSAKYSKIGSSIT
jgi:pilus assembly protein Flp/PilA